VARIIVLGNRYRCGSCVLRNGNEAGGPQPIGNAYYRNGCGFIDAGWNMCSALA